MKMVNSLLLTAAAGLVAVSGAQAADLPVKAKPVEYVKVCSLYGVGFYYIPGTDICMKLGGYVRFQQNFGSTDVTGGPFAGVGGLNTRVSSEDQSYRVRWLLQHDTRQQTAYGTLRTYMILGFSQDSGTDDTRRRSRRKHDRIYATRAFIQLAGFTFGKATSYFDFVSSAAVAYNAGAYLIARYRRRGPCGCCLHRSTRQRHIGHNLVRTGACSRHPSISVPRSSAALEQLAAADLAGTNRLQDIVANLRVDQAWGAAQIAIAAHNNGTSYYGAGPGGTGLVEWNGHPSNKWGGAVTLGLRLNFPMIGPGDYFQGQVVYAKGASQYASNTPGAFLVKQGSTFAFNTVNDGGFTGTAAAPGIYELTTAWSVFASYEHFWTPSLRTSLYGSYVDYSRSDALNNAMCASGLVAGGASALGRAGGCDLNSQYWVVGSRSQWNITKDLYMGFDVLYSKLNSGNTQHGWDLYNCCGVPGNGVAASALYKTGSLDAVSAAWRIHRDIVP